MINHDLHQIKVKIIYFFNKTKITDKYYTTNHSPYYTAHYSPSEDEEFYNQNHQRFYTNQRLHSYNIDQSDNFEPYTRNE